MSADPDAATSSGPIPDEAARLIALDWGTSAMRAYLLGENGRVLETCAEPWGIMHVPGGDFAKAFCAMVGPWRERAPGLPAIASGMIGSRQGWREAPYCPTPARLSDLAKSLTEIGTPDGPLFVVPGVAHQGDIPNVMRGEETEIFGALGRRPALAERSLLIHPGTHAKWVRIENGAIRDFATYMTGEVFAVLKEHSILGRPARDAAQSGKDARTDWDAFERGATTVRDGACGLWPLLFSARSLVLFDRLSAEASLDYLSGLLIGEEMRCALRSPDAAADGPLALIGNAVLNARYARALSLFGAPEPEILEGSAVAGLWRIAVEAGLVAVPSTSGAAGR
jgi:2-dehydro-3-deoxygalactonokinase